MKHKLPYGGSIKVDKPKVRGEITYALNGYVWVQFCIHNQLGNIIASRVALLGIRR